MYHYAGNNPVRYIDPDGRIAFFAFTGIIGGGVGVLYGGYKVYKEYKKTGKFNWKEAVLEVGKDALIGTTIGLGLGLVGGQMATSTALQAGNCLATFGEVTGFTIATATTAASASTTTAVATNTTAKNIEEYLSEFSQDAKDLLSCTLQIFVEQPQDKNFVINIFEEMTNIPQNKKLFAEMNSLVSKLIPVAKDLETVNILKDIQDLTLKFGGQ